MEQNINGEIEVKSNSAENGTLKDLINNWSEKIRIENAKKLQEFNCNNCTKKIYAVSATAAAFSNFYNTVFTPDNLTWTCNYGISCCRIVVCFPYGNKLPNGTKMSKNDITILRNNLKRELSNTFNMPISQISKFIDLTNNTVVLLV